MTNILNRIKSLQDKHKKLDREVTDLEAIREADRTTGSKYDLLTKKKEKLALRDEINRLKNQQKQDS